MDRTWVRSILGLTALVLMASLLAGCGFFSRPFAGDENKLVYGELDNGKGPYQKTMAVLPLGSRVPWIQGDLTAPFPTLFKTALAKEDKKIRMLLPGQEGFPGSLKANDGTLDARTLSALGRESGINLVMAGRLAGVRDTSYEKGFLWRRKLHHVIQFQLDYTVYHTGTGAKILDQSIFYDVDIPKDQADFLKSGKLPSAVSMPKVLSDMALQAGETLQDVLKYIPWEGYVNTVEGNRVTLSFGSSCGLKVEDSLTLYSPGSALSGMAGEQFSAPGTEVGKVKITTVSPNRSEGVLTGGGPVRPGSILRKGESKHWLPFF